MDFSINLFHSYEHIITNYDNILRGGEGQQKGCTYSNSRKMSVILFWYRTVVWVVVIIIIIIIIVFISGWFFLRGFNLVSQTTCTQYLYLLNCSAKSYCSVLNSAQDSQPIFARAFFWSSSSITFSERRSQFRQAMFFVNFRRCLRRSGWCTSPWSWPRVGRLSSATLVANSSRISGSCWV